MTAFANGSRSLLGQPVDTCSTVMFVVDVVQVQKLTGVMLAGLSVLA